MATLKRKRIVLQMTEELILSMLHLPSDLELIHAETINSAGIINLTFTSPEITRPISAGMSPIVYSWQDIIARKYAEALDEINQCGRSMNIEDLTDRTRERLAGIDTRAFNRA